MVRALGFGSIALLAPLAWLMGLLAFWGCEQRLHEALLFALVGGFCLRLVGDGTRVACEDDDEGGECHECESIDDKPVQNWTQSEAMDKIVVFHEDDN